MNILVSNDDGYQAPGIKALTQALSEIGKIWVVAPTRNCSASSSALSVNRPISVKCISAKHYAVEGTPSDCVHLALTGMLPVTFDLVVSGINCGANLGDDVIYSGTVAAAIEGRFLGLPSIAISRVGFTGDNFATAANIAKKLVIDIDKAGISSDTILNVNVPDVTDAQIRGIHCTRLGRRHPSEQSFPDKNNDSSFYIGDNGTEADGGPGTDFDAVRNHYVSVTPLQIDLTKYNEMDTVANWLKHCKITQNTQHKQHTAL